MRVLTTRFVGAVIVAACAAVAGGCGSDDDSGTGSGKQPATAPDAAVDAAPPELDLQVVGRFDSPVHAVSVPGTDMMAVVEQRGRVLLVTELGCATAETCPPKPRTTGRTVIDLRGDVSTGSEQGLLGLAFHPSWPEDPRVFVNYTDRDGDTRIEVWNLPSAEVPAQRDQELMRIVQPYDNHNGGHVVFGPDGFLYVGVGDGGSGGDPEDRAQSTDDLLGSILRLDVDAGGDRGYAPAPGNVTQGAEEVWAIGLRNPWRFSFDAETGDLWIGDVGQDEREEINAVAGDALDQRDTRNFGWRIREGFRPFDDSGTKGPGQRVDPVLDYGRDDGCSVTGGVVYRGRMLPDLRGWYLFGDLCADELRLVRSEGVPGTQPTEGELAWTSRDGMGRIVSFGATRQGEVLVVSIDGEISQVVPA